MAIESSAATGWVVPAAVRTVGVVAEGVELGVDADSGGPGVPAGVDHGWQRRGLGASLMWHALGVAPAL